jgi:excisionase family DNA binding protein
MEGGRTPKNMSSNIRVTRICLECRRPFTAKTTKTNYCGDVCAKRAYKKRKRKEAVADSETETDARQAENRAELFKHPVLNMRQVCLLLGISRSTLHRLIRSRALPYSKPGRRVLFRKESIHGLLSEGYGQTKGEEGRG